MAKHAKLPASGAERWMNCPGSVAACADLPRRPSSFFAMEGTAAHFLAAECLRGDVDAEDYEGQLVAVKDDEQEFFLEPEMREKAEGAGWSVFEADEEMVVGVQLYLDVCNGVRKAMHKTAEVLFETYLDMGWLDKDVGGTADFIAAEPFGMLEIVDLKYGAGVVVEARGNKQTKTYALGALHLYPDCERVKLTIVQPRAPHADGPVRSVEYTRAELEEFQYELVEAAKASRAAGAPTNSGPWCKWCDAKAGCETLRAAVAVQAMADFDDEPHQLAAPRDNDRLAKLLDWAPTIDALLRDAEGVALRELEAGRPVGDYKIVRGRANRRWALPEDEIVKGVKEVDPEAETHATPKLKSPAQMEKISKEVKAKVADLTYKPEGRITVAKGDDARPKVASRSGSAALDFDDEKGDPLA
jgi:uncharacterized protein DUF2800